MELLKGRIMARKKTTQGYPLVPTIERRQVLEREKQTRIIRGLLVWTRSEYGHKSVSLVDFETFEADRLTEVLSYVPGTEPCITYFTSNAPLTAEQLQEEHMKTLLGDVRSQYDVTSSDLSGYLWTTEYLKVGGHDLLQELESFIGKYLHMEVTYYKESWRTIG
jgi:hypothetical protein